jgi:hypothetical protein
MHKDKFIQSFSQKGRNHLEDLHIHGRIIQRLILSFYHVGKGNGNVLNSRANNQILNQE